MIIYIYFFPPHLSLCSGFMCPLVTADVAPWVRVYSWLGIDAVEADTTKAGAALQDESSSSYKTISSTAWLKTAPFLRSWNNSIVYLTYFCSGGSTANYLTSAGGGISLWNCRMQTLWHTSHCHHPIPYNFTSIATWQPRSQSSLRAGVTHSLGLKEKGSLSSFFMLITWTWGECLGEGRKSCRKENKRRGEEFKKLESVFWGEGY